MVDLGLTSLHSHWPQSDNLYLLGRWCLPTPHILDDTPPPPFKLISHDWREIAGSDAAFQKVFNLYRRLLPKVADILNSLHELSESYIFWDKVAGPWLYSHIQIMHLRYSCIQDALDLSHDINSIGLDDVEFQTPIDSPTYRTWAQHPRYNLQLYTQILNSLEVEIGAAPAPTPTSVQNVNKAKTIIATVVRRLLFSLAKRTPVVLLDANVPAPTALALWLSSGGRILSCKRPSSNLVSLPPNWTKRALFRETFLPSNDFETCLLDSFPICIPQTFVESFPRLTKGVKETSMPLAQHWIDANLQASDDINRIEQVKLCEKHGLYDFLQHGGYFGLLKVFSGEYIEEHFSDSKYYSWGWGDSLEPHTTVASLPPLGLVKQRNKLNYRTSKQATLAKAVYCMTEHPLEAQTIFSAPVACNWVHYFNFQREFLKTLAPQARKSLYVRFYMDDCGWGIREKWKQWVGEINQDKSKKLRNHFRTDTLIIIDYPATTMLEALASRTPTLLLWNPNIFEFRKSALQPLENLKTAGIYFDNASSASEKINQLMGRPISWWWSDEVQTAIQDFCAQYASEPARPLHSWRKELLTDCHRKPRLTTSAMTFI